MMSMELTNELTNDELTIKAPTKHFANTWTLFLALLIILNYYSFMGNTFWFSSFETMGTHRKLFLGSVKTSHGNQFLNLIP